MNLRNAEPSDYYFVASVINDWWGVHEVTHWEERDGQRIQVRELVHRNMRDMLPKLFFTHFRNTSFIVEANASLEKASIVGFLNGFLSQTYPEQAYIHFVGVHPEHRKAGVARLLYETFFDSVRAKGCTSVHCVTSPVNKTSIAFHLRMGFEIEPGDVEVDGSSAHSNYDGKGESRVLFTKHL